MAEIDGANAMLGCPSPPIALRRLAYRGKNKKRKQKGPSPPTAIWAIGLGANIGPSTNHHSVIGLGAKTEIKKKTGPLQQSPFG